MLSARPAALLAVLSIKLGIQPLLKSAHHELRIWRTRWNDLEVPENWNVSGLSLVLDTDEAYVHQTKADTGSRVKNLQYLTIAYSWNDLFHTRCLSSISKQHLSPELDGSPMALKFTLVTKECPHCGLPTEKRMGCGHMFCICGKHCVEFVERSRMVARSTLT